MCFNISLVLMRPLPCQIVTLSDLPVATAIPAVHQSTAETWEPAAINRNRLEEAMRSAERDRVVKPMRLSEKKENVSLIDRVYLVSTDRSTSCV